jgi:hypothetical protein
MRAKIAAASAVCALVAAALGLSAGPAGAATVATHARYTVSGQNPDPVPWVDPIPVPWLAGNPPPVPWLAGNPPPEPWVTGNPPPVPWVDPIPLPWVLHG